MVIEKKMKEDGEIVSKILERAINENDYDDVSGAVT